MVEPTRIDTDIPERKVSRTYRFSPSTLTLLQSAIKETGFETETSYIEEAVTQFADAVLPVEGGCLLVLDESLRAAGENEANRLSRTYRFRPHIVDLITEVTQENANYGTATTFVEASIRVFSSYI